MTNKITSQSSSFPMKPRVLFAWHVKDELKQYFMDALSDVAEPVFPDTRDETALFTEAASAQIIVGWAISENLLSAAPQAQLVIIPAIGIDRHIPILRKFPELTAINSRGNAVPTAQHAIALLLAVTNHLLAFDQRMRDGQWRAFDDNPPSLLLNNVPVGVLGTGTVGKEILNRLQPFGCRLSGCSRSGRSLDQFPDCPIYTVENIHDFLAHIRVLIVAVPSTPETTGMIGTPEINLLQPEGIIVNIARGPVIDEAALFTALRDHQLMGAGIDVWYNYQPEPVDGKRYPYSLPFHELPNIVLSPHRGASPLNRPERYEDVVDNIRRHLMGEPVTNRIDPERGY